VRGADVPRDIVAAHRTALLHEVTPKVRVLEVEYLAWLAAVAGDDGCVHLLGEQDGRIVASLGVVRWIWPPSDKPGARGGFIYGLYVEPAARRQGIAAEMIEAAQAWAYQAGLEHLSLLESPLAGRLYRRAGYRSVSRWKLLQFVLIGVWLLCSGRLVARDTG
jgi:GNAT superfamily N-acetyltransferase